MIPVLPRRLVLAILLVAATACQRTGPMSGASGPATPQPSESAHEHEHEATHGPAHEDAQEPTGGHAHEHGEAATEIPADFTGPGRLELDSDLRALLIEEMIQIERGMQELLASMARGQRQRTAELAGQIRDSFVLARKLTAEQRARLVESLPPEMVALDREFHTRAGRLVEAAEAGDLTEAARLYGQMSEACVRCHAAFARERFPGLR